MRGVERTLFQGGDLHHDIEPAMNHANDHAKRVSKIKEIKIAHTNRKQPWNISYYGLEFE